MVWVSMPVMDTLSPKTYKSQTLNRARCDKKVVFMTGSGPLRPRRHGCAAFHSVPFIFQGLATSGFSVFSV